jgi:predicted enzyme related to lactoylglutathione lyase
MGDNPAGKATTIMVDTDDLNGAASFWTQILGLEIKYKDENYCYLGELADGGPHLAFQKVPEPKTVKNRLHFDIQVPDRAAFAEWVVELGGAVVEEHDHPGWPVWIVMADPQGNEFCIYEKPEDAA